MASAGWHWLTTDPGFGMGRLLSPEEGAQAGFDPEYNKLSFKDIVKATPGATPREKLKNALDDVLGRYKNHYDTALDALRNEGPGGLITFTGQGQMVGPRALAGAMRAARQNRELHVLDTTEEYYSAHSLRSQAAKLGARNRRPKETVAREKADLERRRDEAERLYGTRDLRKVPTAGMGRRERLAQDAAARRYSQQQGAREAKKRLAAAQKAAAKAANGRRT